MLLWVGIRIHGIFCLLANLGTIANTNLVLFKCSFSPLYGRDFQKIDETLLAPMIDVLGPIANISVESQVMNHLCSLMIYGILVLMVILFAVETLPCFLLLVIFLMDRFCTTLQSLHFLLGMKN